jgi:hypothetical protein
MQLPIDVRFDSRQLLAVAASVLALCLTTAAEAQQPARTCFYQYADAAGVTPASLLTDGFEIRAGWAGGLWLQKAKAAYFCNTGRVPDNEMICWTLRAPIKGEPCS